MDEYYSSPVMLTGPAGSSSPSIPEPFGLAEPWMGRPVQPTCNTIVFAAAMKRTWRTTVVGLTPPESPSANWHSRREVNEGWCCTFVARGAYEAANRPGNEAQ